MASLPKPKSRPPLFFRDRLMQLRKSYDVWPWIESYRKNWGSWTTGDAPKKDTIQHKQPRNLFASELAHSTYVVGCRNAPGYNSISSYASLPWEVQLARDVDGVTDSSDTLLASQALGTGDEELKRFRTGMRIPAQQLRTVVARTSIPSGNSSDAAYNVGFEHATAVAFRGYQLFPKGSNPTPQYTYVEYAERGYVAEVKVAVLKVPLVPNTTDEMATTYQLPADFAVDYMTVGLDLAASSAAIDFQQLNLLDLCIDAPGRPIMNAFCSASLVGYRLARTAWLWDQPLSALKGDEWKVRVKSRFPFDWSKYSGTVDPAVQLVVALHGHELTRP